MNEKLCSKSYVETTGLGGLWGRVGNHRGPCSSVSLLIWGNCYGPQTKDWKEVQVAWNTAQIQEEVPQMSGGKRIPHRFCPTIQ